MGKFCFEHKKKMNRRASWINNPLGGHKKKEQEVEVLKEENVCGSRAERECQRPKGGKY